MDTKIEQLLKEFERLMTAPRAPLSDAERQPFIRMIGKLEELLATYDGRVLKLMTEAGMPNEEIEREVIKEDAVRAAIRMMLKLIGRVLPTVH